ncbi:arylsulfatase [Agaribacillus aureus]
MSRAKATIDPKAVLSMMAAGLWCVLLATGCSSSNPPTDDKREDTGNTKPNIIYIMADDLGYGDLGCYGQKKIKTPNLDKMASGGLMFTQHYAGSTVCMPSRASLMTGKHQGHCTVRGNPRWTSTGKPVDLSAADVTVAEVLKQAGYTTGIIGKWGLAEAGLESMPLNQGFDYFFGYRKHGKAHHYYPDSLWENNRQFALTGNNTPKKQGAYSHDLMAAKSLEFIENNRHKPFFLYLNFTIPHYELTVPEEAKRPYQNLSWEKRPLKSGHYYHDEEGHTTYAGMVSRMDKDVGLLQEWLKELGIDKHTLVIFTSDNGHEFDREFFNSNGPFRGKKRDLYEGGIRVPFIAYWPDRIKPGSKTDHIAAFWDFLPTACDIAEVKPPDAVDGISYLPVLTGETHRQKQHPYLYWEFNERQGPIQAIRKGEWKAVKFFDKNMELYNLVDDIAEEHDLAAEKPEIVREITSIMEQARDPHAAFPLVPHKRILRKK